VPVAIRANFAVPHPLALSKGVVLITRLDNMENKSDRFWREVKPNIEVARESANRNNQWAASRGMVNPETGEIVTNKAGEHLTLADMSKSWYSERGGRNNAFGIVKRLERALKFESENGCRPKLFTLTFAGDTSESWRAERAIQIFLDDVRKHAKRHGVKVLAYFWSSEVQMKNGRGALHYHILILGLPFVSKEQVGKWWPYGFFDVRAVDDTARAFKYLAKYLWKWGHLAGEPDNLPDWWFLFSVYSKRRYGFSKWFSLPPMERIPRWLKELLQESGALDLLEKASRAEGGGWSIVVRRPEGEVNMHFSSPFKVVEFKQ
jgi:hypothetical protein